MKASAFSQFPLFDIKTGDEGGQAGDWKVAVVQTAYANGASTRE